jgi:hypothetical protein
MAIKTMHPPRYTPPPYPTLNYAPPLRARPWEVAFWTIYSTIGALLCLLSLSLIGRTTPAALVLHAACVLWIASIVLRIMSSRFMYAAAGAWVALLWVPMCVQVFRRLYYWATIGMEPPDGMGSPIAFLIGFIIEWLLFLPLTFMLVFLIRAKPWRHCPARDGQDETRI